MDKNLVIRKKSAAGVSIVEIMISLVLVAIGLLAITTVFPSMAKHRKGIQEAEQAKMIATEVIEGLQFLSYEGGCKGLETGGGMQSLLGKYKDLEKGSTKYTATLPDGLKCVTGANEISTVTVKVEWKKSGKTHNIKMTGALL
jgi:type II secretory pathway pseudopilin PulG